MNELPSEPPKRKGRRKKYVEAPARNPEPANPVTLPEKPTAQPEPSPRLLVVLPFTESDRDLATGLLSWIGKLGRQEHHTCLLIADTRQKRQDIIQVGTRAALVFKRVDTVTTPFALPKEDWPFGANWMFETAMRAVSERKRLQPWLWLEPDCVPMRRGWLEEIETAYHHGRKPFMGHIVFPRKASLPERMLSGVAVYPPDAHVRLLPRVVQQKMKKAFDVATADLSVPHTWPTRLLWNFHGEAQLPPTFVTNKTPKSPRNAVLRSRIPEHVALFHRCKDGSLINILRGEL